MVEPEQEWPRKSFKLGDVVRLASEYKTMTVTALLEKGSVAQCSWLKGDGSYEFAKIHVNCLKGDSKKVEPTKTAGPGRPA